MRNKKTILLVGGLGYIGGVLSRISRQKYNVIVLDSRVYGQDKLDFEYDEFWEEDMRDISASDLKGIWGVIHLASSAMPDYTNCLDYSDIYMHNMEGTINLVKACKKSGVDRFSFMSTTSTYGHRAHDNEACERIPPSPDERYGEVKVLIETYLRKEVTEDFSPVIIRQGTVFGWSPRMRFDLIVCGMTKDALTKGKIIVAGKGDLYRPQVYIEDVAKAHLLALERAPRFKGEIFNLAYGNYTVLDIAEKVSKIMNVPIEHCDEPKDRRSYRVDTKKTDKLLYKPKVSIEEGIKEIQEKLNEFSGNVEDEIYYNSRILPRLYPSEVKKEI